MSGGHFDYIQFRIDDAAEDLERIIETNNKEKTKEILSTFDYDENGEVYEDCKYYYGYEEKTIEHFKDAVFAFKKAAIYMQRVDWLLCGDDGEDDFQKRLEKELKELEEKQ